MRMKGIFLSAGMNKWRVDWKKQSLQNISSKERKNLLQGLTIYIWKIINKIAQDSVEKEKNKSNITTITVESVLTLG